MRHRTGRILAGLTAGLLAAAGARGQGAWLPPQGEAFLLLGYGNLYGDSHWVARHPTSDGSYSEYAGPMRSQTVGLVVGYGITDRLALTASIPFVDSRYGGKKPHTAPDGHILTPDDGQYHGYFADYRINLGFQAVSGTFSLAPFVTGVIPSHDYPTLAHAAPGKGQKQLELGFGAGASLDRIVPGTFVEVYYDYAFVEEVLNINTNRSDFGFQLGYFLTPSLRLSFLSSGWYTHGGITYKPQPPKPEYYVHDQITRSQNGSVGGGLSYVLTGSTEISVSYLRNVYGRGVTKIDHGLSFGVSYSFSPERILRGLFPPKPEVPVGPLGQ
jgi:hypothetical protein